ncbi:MAG: hypothetical protein ACPGU7_10885 [Gammaproteobacteria bacterium]
MPGGGIGPVRLEQARALREARRGTHLPSGISDTELFYNLGVGRVFFDPERGLLYFVDSVQDPVPELVSSILGMPAVVEQLHMDRHGVFNAAKRIALRADQRDVVLVALRLHGYQVLLPRR